MTTYIWPEGGGTTPVVVSGGGGQLYYFNGAAGDAPLPAVGTRELGRVAEVPQTIITSAVLPNDGVTYVSVVGFVTDLNVPGQTAIPAGLWDFNVWARGLGPSLAPNVIRFRLKVYQWDGVTATLLATSSPIPLFDPTQVVQYIGAALLPQTPIAATDRVYVLVEATATSNNHRVEIYMGDATPSHVHTTLLTPGPFDLAFQGENTGTSPLVIGSVYLPGFALTTASRVLLGVVGAGTATLRLVEQATSTVIATWTRTGALTDVPLAAPTAALPAGWYVFDLAGDAGGTVTRCYGAHLE